MVGSDGLFLTILGSMLLLPSGIYILSRPILYSTYCHWRGGMWQFSGPETRLPFGKVDIRRGQGFLRGDGRSFGSGKHRGRSPTPRQPGQVHTSSFTYNFQLLFQFRTLIKKNWKISDINFRTGTKKLVLYYYKCLTILWGKLLVYTI